MIEIAKKFYHKIHADHKIHQEMSPYCISLVRTKCILGILLVAVFYENGKAIRYLECTVKDWPYVDEMKKKIYDREDPSGQLWLKYQEELVLRRQPTYSFLSLGLTFKVGNDWEQEGHRHVCSWKEDAQSVTKEQFNSLLELLQGDYKGLGHKWVDLNWEDWGK